MSLSSRSPLLLLGLAMAVACTGQAPREATSAVSDTLRLAFDSTLSANTYTLRLQNGELRGSGADWLTRRARQADHFLIGERHGTAEIPRIVGALYERLEPLGYNYAALEIGPFTARKVNATLQAGGLQALRALITRYDNSPIAFFDWAEEARLAARIVRSGGTLWGVDQEFMYSLPLHLKALAREAETDPEKEALRKIREAMQGEQDYVADAQLSSFGDLRRRFSDRGDTEALARIDALIASNRIYAPYTRDIGTFYESGVMRENYMKKTLTKYLDEAEDPSPKVLYKLGDVHSRQYMASPSDGRVYLGVFLSEWARVRGERTFHVLLDCLGGRVRGSGQGSAGDCESFLSSGEGELPALLQGHMRSEGITVIDLRALRPQFHDWEEIGRAFRSLMLAYDALVMIPDVTPASVMPEFQRNDR